MGVTSGVDVFVGLGVEVVVAVDIGVVATGAGVDVGMGWLHEQVINSEMRRAMNTCSLNFDISARVLSL